MSLRILVTNDDGIAAPGLKALVAAAKSIGEVKVVAPDRERSACGHSMTMADPLRIQGSELLGCEAMSVSGVPVDCVNVGLTVAWPDGCDLVISGFNNGPNLGFDVTYSGTVAGAMEGAINGIRSIAFSMAALEQKQDRHFATGTAWVEENWKALLSAPLPPRTFLNVNIPAIPFLELKGLKVTRMGGRVYEDRVESRLDPWGKPYFWQGGVATLDLAEPMSDLEAIREKKVAITPLKIEWTDLSQLGPLSTHFGEVLVNPLDRKNSSTSAR